MLTPDYLLHISEGAEEISAQMHTDMLKRIVSRIQARQKRGDTYILTSSDKWQLESLQDAGYLRNDLAQEVAKYTGIQAEEIKQAMEDAGVRTMAYDDRIYQQAGLSDTKQPLSPYMERLMQRNYEATMHEWSNYTRTTADAAQDWFISAMDNVYNQVTFGGVGYIQAFTETIDKLAETGLYITYPSGHRDTIETATLRCVRTGVSQATAQIQEQRMNEIGVDLVLVSSHQGARPSHQVWQGKVYSRSGTDSKYPDFVSNTHYGSGDGLCGWNCRHQFMPYFEGMHNPFYRYDNKENRQLYEDTQVQRSMERAVRKTKRNIDVLKAAQDGDPDHADAYSGKLSYLRQRLKVQQTAYYDFCEKKDLRPLPERMKIAKAGRARPHDSVQIDFIKPNLTPGMTIPTPITPVVTPVEPPEPVGFVEKMKTIISRVRKNGNATDADLHEAGKLVKGELQKANEGKDKIREEIRVLIDKKSDYDLKISELSEKIQDIIDRASTSEFDPFKVIEICADNPEIDALQQQIDAIMGNGEYKDLCDRIDKLKLQVRSDAHNNADTLKGILSQFREMGHPDYKKGVKSRTATGNVLRDALNYYPKEWVQYAIDSGGISCKSVSRGYCNTYENLIALSGMGDDDTLETAFHELGHYFERKVSISDTYVPYDSSKHWWVTYEKNNYKPGQSYILDAEREFYKRRTDGEDLKWMGIGYGKKEVTRKDDFIHPYMGKWYDSYDFELVSMGFEYAYAQPETLAKDPDMEEWIYGILSIF